MPDKALEPMRDSLVRICGEHDVVLIDTSCYRASRIDQTAEEMALVRGVVGPGCGHVTHGEEIKYLDILADVVRSHPNVQTVGEVVTEINKGFWGLREPKQENYRSRIKALRNMLEERLVDFSTGAYNFDLLRERLAAFSGYGLSEKDLSLVAASMNSASYLGSTATLSNDSMVLNWINTAIEANRDMHSVAILAHGLVSYTSIASDRFHPYVRQDSAAAAKG